MQAGDAAGKQNLHFSGGKKNSGQKSLLTFSLFSLRSDVRW